MRINRKLWKGTSFLSASEFVSQGCSLIRNIILARFLTKADFGVASLLGIVLTLFELSGKMALSQQVIQSKRGDEPGFVSSVQFTQFAAGSISALLILLAAWPLAHFFSGHQYLASIMALALIPFVNGLNNLDVFRYARRFSFGPMVLTDMVPQLVTTLAAWPLAVYFKDYRAVLVLLLGKAFVSATMTHWLAERRYSLSVDGHWVRESLKFGWPLLLNGFIQIGNFQGDSMVVAAAFPLAQLGVYSVAMSIAMTPGFAILRIGSSLGLPLLAEVQNDLPRFIVRYGLFVQSMALIGCAATLGMLFCGEQMVVMIFGAKYAGVGALACWLTAAQSVRILRGASIVASMARGDTVNNLVSSLWRLSGLLLAVIVGLLKCSITWFAVAALVGEVVALAATIIRLDAKHSVAPKATLMPAALGVASVVCAGVVKWLLELGPHSYVNWLFLPIFLLLSIGMFTLCFRELRVASAGATLHFRTRFGWPTPPAMPTMLSGDPTLSGDLKD
jgi:O-antigen/teichoic acid export membrane protein